MRNSNHNDFYT